MYQSVLNEVNDECLLVCLDEMMHAILGLYYELLPCHDLLGMTVLRLWCLQRSTYFE